MTSAVATPLKALAHLSRQWTRTPPCFTPNAAAYDQRDRGLIEIKQEQDRFWLRLTEAGEQVRDCRGAA